MKKFFWTTIFWILVVAGFLGYLKWFDQPLAVDLSSMIIKTMPIVECPSTTNKISEISSDLEEITSTGDTTPLSTTGVVSVVQPINTSSIDTKLDEIKAQLRDINEKLDIQNSNTPDAVSVSLKTTKKTNVWIFPLDGSDYKKYVMPASDDILKDTLDLLFEKSPFALVDSKLDNDGNLNIIIQRVPGTSFGGSAAVEATRNAIEKTALQFSQIKKVMISPEEVLQP